jgi:hypothetical protein
MAYDLHIENTNKSIEQWNEFVAASSSLSPKDKAEAVNPATGEKITIETPGAAISENGLFFSPLMSKRGFIITISNPDTDDIPFLKTVAEQFGGVLVGDEGEQY